MNIIKLTNSQKKLLETLASKIDGQYYYIPYWFRKTETGYEVYNLDHIPDHLKVILANMADKEIRENFNKPYPITEYYDKNMSDLGKSH